MRKSLLLVSLCTFLWAAAPSTGLFLIPKGWPQPRYDFARNPLSPAKITLGRALFYDPALSRDSSISCASCHSPFSAFTHVDHDLSHGIEDRIGLRNSPALMNLAWQTSFMWDGAIHHLDMQALAPITHPDEMGSSLAEVTQKLRNSPLYHNLFYQAYGDSTITGERTLKAISQFLLTLVSANSKYDQVSRQEAVFTDQERKGYQLFQKNCASCHPEPLFTNHQFMANGLPPDTTLKDYGRLRITHRAQDSLRFKVPTLRNIEFTYPYMHDGRFKKLSEVLRHYTTGVSLSKSLPPALRKGIDLTDHQKTDLLAFLLTLSDTEFVFNPAHQFPREIFSASPPDFLKNID